MSYFAPLCGGHGRRVLLGDRQVDALHPVPGGGVALDFTCTCGWSGTLLPDGRTLPLPGATGCPDGPGTRRPRPAPAEPALGGPPRPAERLLSR